ncbi:MAG: hypothetical protein M1322_00955 [Candidatus Parvarchaeota archaeon]|jgi:hypothetical protein|nr:hypothetical protein [Candidatus Parvarchaeota archaeon]
MATVKNDEFIQGLSIKLINFIRIMNENLEFFEEKVYKEDVFLYILGVK